MAWDQTRASAVKGRQLTKEPWHGPVSVILTMDTNHLTNKINRFTFNLLKPTAYVMHQQFNIQQQYALPTLYSYLCVLN